MQFLSDLKGVGRLEAAFGALGRTATDDRGGRARNHARANYVSMLAQIYENITGKSPRVRFSYDPDKEVYRGPFLSFVKRNLDMVKPGHGLSSVALGTLLRRLLRASQKPPLSS